LQDGKDFWRHREPSCKAQNGIMLWKLEIPGGSEKVPTLCIGKLFHTSQKHPWATGGGKKQNPQSVTVTAHPSQLVPKRKRQLEVSGRERRCMCPHEKFCKMLKGSLIAGVVCTVCGHLSAAAKWPE